jgi:hypothetical protein
MTRTRTWIAGMILGPVNAVLFGLGAVTVLTVPALREHAAILIPAVVVLSFAAAVPASLAIAPRMRSRRWVERQQGR